MALWVCLGCSAAYAVGLPGCPQCRGTDYHEEGTMPKISKAHGPTDGSPDPARVVAPEPVVEAIEAAPAADPAADPAPETETPTTVEGGGTKDGEGTGPEQGQHGATDGATDGATATDGEGAGDEPAVAPKPATRRRTTAKG